MHREECARDDNFKTYTMIVVRAIKEGIMFANASSGARSHPLLRYIIGF